MGRLTPEEKKRIRAEEGERAKTRLIALPVYVVVGCGTALFFAVGAAIVVAALLVSASQNAQTTSQRAAARLPTPAATPILNFSDLPAQQPESQPESDAKLYSVGENISMGVALFRIDGVRFEKSLGMQYVEQRADPGSKFAIVGVNILNQDKIARAIMADNFKLIDNQQRIFDVSDRFFVLGANINTLIIMQKIQPSIPWSGFVIFSVPDSLPKESLYLHINLASGAEALVSLK